MGTSQPYPKIKCGTNNIIDNIQGILHCCGNNDNNNTLTIYKGCSIVVEITTITIH
jgi:hypothetical protein